MDLIHGGDIAGFERLHGRAPLDFSASLNPLGMPAGVTRAARDAVDKAEPYPDPLCRKLREAMADKLSLNADWIFCGNGAADVIHRLTLARRPARALLVAPSFAEYERALHIAGCEIVYHDLDREGAFAIDKRYLERLTPDIDIAFLCQPNNPTGGLLDREFIVRALGRCEQNGTLLVVDECFVPFVDAPDSVGMTGWLGEHPSLFLLGSFTKLYAMAGLRLGFGLCSDIVLVEQVCAAGQPWSVSSVAQAAGLAALAEDAYVEESLAVVRRERQWLAEQLRALGIEPAGEANYLFFHTDIPRLADALAEDGILIRDCANFRGLRRGDYRIAVRSRDENARLIAALRRIAEKA